MKHWRYLKAQLLHKWLVFIECCRLGLPLQGLAHDLDKFLPSMWKPYVNFVSAHPDFRYDSGDYTPVTTGDKAFERAWFWHTKRNGHHWQFWVMPQKFGAMKVFKMPSRYVREMVADWSSVGKEPGKDGALAWYRQNRTKMLIHPESRKLLEELLGFVNGPDSMDTVMRAE